MTNVSNPKFFGSFEFRLSQELQRNLDEKETQKRRPGGHTENLLADKQRFVFFGNLFYRGRHTEKFFLRHAFRHRARLIAHGIVREYTEERYPCAASREEGLRLEGLAEGDKLFLPAQWVSHLLLRHLAMPWKIGLPQRYFMPLGPHQATEQLAPVPIRPKLVVVNLTYFTPALQIASVHESVHEPAVAKHQSHAIVRLYLEQTQLAANLEENVRKPWSDRKFKKIRNVLANFEQAVFLASSVGFVCLPWQPT